MAWEISPIDNRGSILHSGQGILEMGVEVDPYDLAEVFMSHETPPSLLPHYSFKFSILELTILVLFTLKAQTCAVRVTLNEELNFVDVEFFEMDVVIEFQVQVPLAVS